MVGLREIDHSRLLRIAKRLVEQGETIAISDSSAGGLISAALLTVPGASAYSAGGGVIYTRKAIGALFDPSPDKLDGIRSATEPMACLLADTVRSRLGADWGLAKTGATGPNGNRYGDAAGHACLAVSGKQIASRTLETGSSDRVANMVAFANAALELLEEWLLGMEKRHTQPRIRASSRTGRNLADARLRIAGAMADRGTATPRR